MMFAMLLMAAAEAAPVVRRESLNLESPSFPYELRVPVQKYLKCLSPVGSSISGSATESFRKDVERCRSERELMERESFQLLREGNDEEEVRSFVRGVFDAQDAGHIDHGRKLDAFAGRPATPETTRSGQQPQ